jgi:small subunit ribosomal protein S21|tara:strand:- start:45 stop:236 length:192 start_codon:yes stop_codon:yes gene_type:complete
MIIIKIGSKENIDRALKRWKNKVYKTKQLNRLREQKEYTKKSTKRRKEKQKAIYIQKIKDSEN